MSKRTVIIFI